MHTHTVRHRASLAWLHAWRSYRHLKCLKCGQELWLHVRFPGFYIMPQLPESAIRTRQKPQCDRMTPPTCFLSHEPINHKHNTEICVIKGNLHTLSWNIGYVLSDFGAVDAVFLLCVVGRCVQCRIAIAVTVAFSSRFSTTSVIRVSGFAVLCLKQKSKSFFSYTPFSDSLCRHGWDNSLWHHDQQVVEWMWENCPIGQSTRNFILK